MKKIFILLGLLGILLAPIAQACEYSAKSYYQYIPIYRPVISGINAPANMINSWSFLQISTHNEFVEMMTDNVVTVGHFMTFCCAPITLSRKVQKDIDIHLPMTVYVSLLGSDDPECTSKIKHPYHNDDVYYVDNRYDRQTYLSYFRLRFVSLQYRIFPSMEWNSAGHIVLNTDNGSLDGRNASIVNQLSYNSITKASLPDHNQFTMIREKSLPILGAYTIDADVPAGTMVQLRLVSYYTFTVFQDSFINAQMDLYIQPEPSSYYAEPLSTLKNNEGDYVTVTASGKRRPRHDK